jgi:glutamine amidotransferase
VSSAFARAGAEVEISADPDTVRDAPLAVIAGVGHAGAALAGLETRGLDEVLRARAEAGRPLLGICVGMQLLFGESDEGGAGLGLFDGPVKRLQARRVPHMGWNALRLEGEVPLLDGLAGADVYFAHSYSVRPTEDLPRAE